MEKKWILLFAFAVASSDVAAEDAASATRTVRLAVRPSAVADLPLRCRLLNDASTAAPGNAALGYYRALVLYANADLGKFEREIGDAVGDDAKPLDKKRVDEIVLMATVTIRELGRAVRKANCDWELPLKEDGYETLLPEFQNSRNLTRLLILKAHAQIADKQFDAAADTLQIVFGMGRHVAKAPLLIAALIGTAEVGVGLDAVEKWIGQDGSPNLFWSLAALPQPIIDGAPSVARELELIRGMFPEVFQADDATRSAAEWQKLLDATTARLNNMQGTLNGRLTGAQRMQDQIATLGIAMMAYPTAKQQLIASGWNAAQVEKMPVAQVLLIHTREAFERVAQNHLRWWSMPYLQAKSGFAAEEAKLAAHRNRFEMGLPIAQILMPAFGHSMAAFARVQRRVAALQVVEAVRHFAAMNGRLPNSLAEIKDLPLPQDPLTGSAFEFRLAEGKGVLDLSKGASQPAERVRYEIELKKN